MTPHDAKRSLTRPVYCAINSSDLETESMMVIYPPSDLSYNLVRYCTKHVVEQDRQRQSYLEMSCCFGGKLLYVGNLGTLAGSLLSLFSPGTRSVAVKEARGKEEVQKAFAPRDDGEKVFEMGRPHQLRGGAVTCRETVAVPWRLLDLG
jgi:hypothetical protein